MKRIFKRNENELVLIDEEKDIIKFYRQDADLGFTFSECIMSLKEWEC